jgi:hypothetical protein
MVFSKEKKAQQSKKNRNYIICCVLVHFRINYILLFSNEWIFPFFDTLYCCWWKKNNCIDFGKFIDFALLRLLTMYIKENINEVFGDAKAINRSMNFVWNYCCYFFGSIVNNVNNNIIAAGFLIDWNVFLMEQQQFFLRMGVWVLVPQKVVEQKQNVIY